MRKMATIPDLAYSAANLTGLASGILSVVSVYGTAYALWVRRVGTMIDKNKDLLAIAKESRNVFLAFMAVLLVTVAPSVKVNDMKAAEAVCHLAQTYCTLMLITLAGTFVCSVIGVFKGPLTQTVKEYISSARMHSLVFAIAGMLMAYVTSLA